MDKIYYSNIHTGVEENTAYRKVVYTGNLQLVYMTMAPSDTIHKEIHKTHDQFIRIEEKIGEAILNNKTYPLHKDIAIIIPAGVEHFISNISKTQELKLYTIYSPSEHPEGLIQQTNPDNFKYKYLKFKTKYLMLKNKKIEKSNN